MRFFIAHFIVIQRTDLLKTITKYIGIGFLLGVGISVADWIYIQITMKEREAHLKLVRDMFYVEGFETILDGSKEYEPYMGLNFNLERAKLLDNHTIQVTGIVSNNGVDIWRSAWVEVEAFNKRGEIIAECHDLVKGIKPKDWESIIMECPVIEGVTLNGLPEVSFQIKQAFHDKRVIPKKQ
ncbi:hypothetical protein LOH54_02795 [Sulfurimonas sp. HSL-3221]|uniref:hypothetical protein n=1 Tax=Sulfurimonadaceae TaxID=2771471 RepID=UPI001E36528C|nr:hypothetical protein [Sulfurimonas sp. HSL-3221]UFS63062.1 hypothetical protein LOH54_02795 [Sulfurimonas sp. HSL-3221]